MKHVMLIFALGLILLTGNVDAQKKATKFTSVYTNTGSDCKTIKGTNGSDDASDCRGAGGYRINIYASAATLSVSASTPDKKESMTIATQNFDFDNKPHTVEWRLENGKPFAVILRVDKYGAADDANPYLGKKIGEELVVVGLKGFENIDFKVDAGTPNANVKARGLADSAYQQK